MHLRFLLALTAMVCTHLLQAQSDSDAFEDCNCPEGIVGQRCRFDVFLDSIHTLEAAILSYDGSFVSKNYAESETIGSKVLEHYNCEALRDSILSLNVQLTNAMGCSDSESCNYNPASTSKLNCEYPTTWYYDGDGDGLGRDSTEVACTASLNFVDNNADLCDDTLAYNYNDLENLACIYPPIPEALNASGMAGETATLNGEVSNPSGLEILEVGFYFNTDTLMPAGTNQTLPATLIEGGLTFDLSALVIGTKYYYQVYAVTPYGTVVSSTQVFTASTGPCEGLTTATDYDGNTYNLVEIGTQCWFAQNLIATSYSNGDAIPSELDNAGWMATVVGAVTTNPTNGAASGYLYNWYAVNDPRGLCPASSHVASEAEWDELEAFCGGASVAAGKIKASAQDNPPWDGSNETGFGAPKTGFRNSFDGTMMSTGFTTYIWTSTLNGPNPSCRQIFGASDELISLINAFGMGYAVRCIKD